MSKHVTDLSQTMASDLPYTKEGLLDFGALCSTQRFSKNTRMNHMQQAIYGCNAIVSVLQTDDGALCSIGNYARGGLLDALSALLATLAADADKIEKDLADSKPPSSV